MLSLDPQANAWLASLQKLSPRDAVSAARRAIWRAAARFESDAPPLLERRVLTVPGPAGPLSARLYVPYAAGSVSGGLVFFHGGGFVTGDLDSHEMVCRRIAAAGRIRVLSVAYRLAPEAKWPAAPDDCLAATVWAAGAGAGPLGFDPARIAVGGDSAGGNLAAVTAIACARGMGPALKAQLLIYPCTQLVLMTPSQIRLRQAHAWTQAAQDWFVRQYLPEPAAAHDWRASPLLAEDLRGAAAAYVLTAGLDPLLDEGKAYADKLAAFGVATTYVNMADQPHGFVNLTAVSRPAREALAAAGQWLGRVLG